MSTSPRRLGKYELLEQLGEGGMAEVWKAFDPQLKRYVAIKFLQASLRSTPNFMSRFIREGQAIASLHHPNIVQVYDFLIASPNDEGPAAYMIMDYIEGQTLEHFIALTSRVQQFPTANDIVYLFASISLAIDYAHEHDVIHRDIKPANILLDRRNTKSNPMGEPILTDFGLVKMMGEAGLTVTGMTMGTPLYISPEQIQGQPGDQKSDLYSLGVVMYETCTGVPPFQGERAYILMRQHVQDAPPPPSQINPHLPPALDSVMARFLAKNPEARYPTASSMTVALAQAFGVQIPEQIRNAVYSSNNVLPVGITQSSSPIEALKTASSTILAQEKIISDIHSPGFPGPETIVTAGKVSYPHVSMTAIPGNVKVPDERFSSHTTSRDTPRPFPLISVAEPVSQSSPLSHRSSVYQHRRLYALVFAAVLFVLISSSLGALLLAHKGTSPSSTVSVQTIGQASFFSSSQLNTQGLPGFNDGIQVHLEHVANPTAGNRYYAWLQNDQTETASVFLGSLTINQGVASLTYTDPQHRDLLAITSKFLVTEETASVTPNNPPLDRRQWRYFAALPQIRSPKDNFSYLDHLRHLLSNEPGLQRLNLQGGVDFWFLNNVEEMQKEALEVRDHTKIAFVRQQIANVLYYLDGKCAPQDLTNAQGNKLPENADIAHATSIGLLDCPLQSDPPGHITHIGLHLNGIAQAPGASPEQVKRAIEINEDLNPIKAWLVQMRVDARQLVVMNDAQLAQAQALRNDLAIQADYAVNGRIDPATQALQPSVRQVCNTIELLANFGVMLYKA